MNQVEYNARYALYANEQKVIRAKYRALCNAVEPASPEEEVLEAQEEAALEAAKQGFARDARCPHCGHLLWSPADRSDTLLSEMASLAASQGMSVEQYLASVATSRGKTVEQFVADCLAAEVRQQELGGAGPGAEGQPPKSGA